MVQRVFSGVQPSGTLTIGNYLGALRQFVALQDTAECWFCVVNLHALTVPQDPAALRRHTREVAAMFLAVGIDPARSVLFVQSDVAEHAQLAWLMESTVHMGELERMTQFKDKAEGKAAVRASLFTYPALMAADILLYQTDRVPVGEDQKQHLELTRDLALRFNATYGPTFKVPEPIIPSLGGRIMALDNPLKKMSKSSQNPKSYIALTDAPDDVRKKVRAAVTDSGREVRYDPDNQPAVANLLTIYALVTGQSPQAVADRLAGQGYGALKRGLADALVALLEPIQARYQALLDDPDHLDAILRAGAAKARAVAAPTLALAYQRVGLDSVGVPAAHPSALPSA